MISEKTKKILEKEGFWVQEYENGKINIVSCIKVEKSTMDFHHPHKYINATGEKMAGD